ncbi:hypothetical protein LP414_11905 [Polaromonas sp. P1(28)-13]|nr:hypothetical protein LP414_11905 [Polaromonas sp. P1(28)-13]
MKALDKTLRQHEKQLADAAQADGKRANTDRKTKVLKTALEALHTEVKESEVWFSHIQWLQERFSASAVRRRHRPVQTRHPRRGGRAGLVT